MELQDIQEKINNLLAGTERKIVFWYDDIVGKFCDFIRIVFGEESLEANLAYIANILGTKGNSPAEQLREYFLNDFYKDHCSMYSVTGSEKRPIYWMFDLGKQFKSLTYRHRYDKDAVGRIRSEYLIRTQKAIEIA